MERIRPTAKDVKILSEVLKSESLEVNIIEHNPEATISEFNKGLAIELGIALQSSNMSESSKQIIIDSVLSNVTIDDIVALAANKKVNSLSRVAVI